MKAKTKKILANQKECKRKDHYLKAFFLILAFSIGFLGYVFLASPASFQQASVITASTGNNLPANSAIDDLRIEESTSGEFTLNWTTPSVTSHNGKNIEYKILHYTGSATATKFHNPYGLGKYTVGNAVYSSAAKTAAYTGTVKTNPISSAVRTVIKNVLKKKTTNTGAVYYTAPVTVALKNNVSKLSSLENKEIQPANIKNTLSLSLKAGNTYSYVVQSYLSGYESSYSDVVIFPYLKEVRLQATDVKPTDWFHKSVQSLTSVGVFDQNDKFRPGDKVNRAEMAKMVLASMEVKVNSSDLVAQKEIFCDTPKGSWFVGPVNYMADKGWVSGYPSKKCSFGKEYQPAKNITRAAAIKILLAAYQIDISKVDTSTQLFTDVKSTDWFAPYVHAAYEAGIIDNTKETFRPNAPINRAEMAKILILAIIVL